MKTNVVKVQVSKNYLLVRFTIKDQVVKQQHLVRIPWRDLLGEYEGLMNGLESAALKQLGENRGQYELPLEKWE